MSEVENVVLAKPHCNKTYNVSLRHLRLTAVARKNNNYYTICVCICSVRYPACNARAPYFHLWPAPLYNIFPQTVRFSKIKVLEYKMCVSSFSKTLSKTFFILIRNERDIIQNAHWSSCKVPFILV